MNNEELERFTEWMKKTNRLIYNTYIHSLSLFNLDIWMDSMCPEIVAEYYNYLINLEDENIKSTEGHKEQNKVQ
jgi:hypothetical protein